MTTGTTKKFKILIIDDSLSVLHAIKEALKQHNYRILTASAGKKGIQSALRSKPDLILLDILMPETDGFETCKKLKQMRATKDIPIIFMSSLNQVFNKVKAFQSGAVDYIVKPVDNEELLARVYTHVTRNHLQLELQKLNSKLEETVQQRTAELMKANAAREASLDMYRMYDNLAPDEIIQYGLEEGKFLTESKTGFFHLIESNLKQSPFSKWTKKSFLESEDTDIHINSAFIETTLCVDCFTRKKPVVHNTYESSVTKSNKHAGFIRDMLIPVLENNEIVAVLGVANKETEYNEVDIDILRLITNNLWNIIRRKQAEKELHELNEKLEIRVQKRTKQLENLNKELRDFAYIVSHDLKAPLRGVSQLSTWLAREYENVLDKEGQRLLNLLRGRVLRMNQLIEGILQYSRVSRKQEKTEEFHSYTVISDVIEALAPPDHIHIHIENQMPVLNRDKTKIYQIYQNLISNAIKYMDKSEGYININSAEKENEWEFSVSDNGAGIAEKHYDHIFKIFKTLSSKNDNESTGIGLTIVKRIVQQYNGKVWIESRVGEGSTFYFTLAKCEGEFMPRG